MAESVKWGSTKRNRNGGQLSELDGTEWLYPLGAPSTGRAPKRGVGGLNPLGDGLQSVRNVSWIS